MDYEIAEVVSTANAALPEESIPSLTMIVVWPIRWASAWAVWPTDRMPLGVS